MVALTDTVLVMVGDAAVARAMTRLIRDAGLEPRTEISCREGLDAIAMTPSLRAALFDARVGGEDGLALAEKARELAPHLPILVLTGSACDLVIHRVFRIRAHLIAKVGGYAELVKIFCATSLPHPYPLSSR